MSAGVVEFANVDDPLNLGTNVICIDEGGLGGAELMDLKDIKNATGGFHQGNARTKKEEGTVRYYPNGNLTMAGGTATVESSEVVAVGQTKQGYYITKVIQSSDNENHKMIDVTARKHTAGDFVTQE